MKASDIEDVLNVSGILTSHSESDGAHNPGLIADLIAWRDGKVDTPPEPKLTKRGNKAKPETPDDTAGFEPTPDPASDEPDF